MALRKPLYMTAEGYQDEMPNTDSIELGGLKLYGALDANSQNITNLPDTPSAGTSAVNKNYVDAVAQSLVIKLPVKGLSATNIASLSGLATTVDTNVALDTDGDRVLLTGQSTASENGIWVVHSGAWTRPTDFAAASHASGAFTFVERGTLYADTGWVCTTDRPNDVVGTNDLAFAQFSSAGVITAGSGLQKVGNEISVKKGDGIELTSNSGAVNIDLATNSGLELSGTSPNKELKALIDTTGGLQINGANGLALYLNGTTLQTNASGVSVKGLPNLFEIGGTATSQTPGTGQVTAANLNTLTAGSSSNADALHTHAVASAPYASRVENALAVVEAVAAGDPVYQSATNDQVGKADAGNDAKSRVIGLARTAQSTPGNSAPIVEQGVCASVLTGATPNTPYYLADGGGLTTTRPTGGKRVILIGFAKNATDLHVRITDYGKSAA